MSDLTDMEDKIEVILRDTTNLIFSTAQLEEAISLALAEYNATLQVDCTIAGLDSATITTLPTADKAMLKLAAAGYATLSRAVERSEAYNLAQDAPPALKTWGDNRLAAFRRQLERIRARNMMAGAVPWDASLPWPMDKDDKNV